MIRSRQLSALPRRHPPVLVDLKRTVKGYNTSLVPSEALYRTLAVYSLSHPPSDQLAAAVVLVNNLPSTSLGNLNTYYLTPSSNSSEQSPRAVVHSLILR